MSRVRKQPPPDPVTNYGPPEGYHEEWIERPDRRAATEEERQRKCRRHGCERAPVMALQRSGAYGPQWWLYCDWHLYGSRIADDGRVLSRRLVPDEQRERPA